MSKQERRVNKKQNRLKHTLSQKEDITLSETLSKHLVVGNGGLGNGISRETIKDLFSPHGQIEHIVMQERKPYCFISYVDIESAKKAYASLHGMTLKCADQAPGVKLYLGYVDKVPGAEPSKRDLPHGLKLIPDFVNEEEETLLLESVDWDSLDANLTEGAHSSLKHRKVKHYGYEFIYGLNNVNKHKPLEQGIPEPCLPIMERMKQNGHISHTPDQLTVNQYIPGQGIPPHVDTHSAFEDEIASLSLGSQVAMEFRTPDGKHSSVLLPRRSLLVMSGESRYKWTHGITPRKLDVVNDQDAASGESGVESQKDNLTLLHRETRTSFTFRKIRQHPCDCKYQQQCDDQQSGKVDTDQTELPSSNTDAQRLEALHVHQVYEEIAGHFSDTRHSPWPKVVEFLQSVPRGSIIFDVGCGNGKYLSANSTCFQVGCDRSTGLCAICVERGFPVFVADCLALPVRSGSIDVCISIAVIHHLSTHERRIEAVREMIRVLGPGGQALISVWALEQRMKKTESKYITKQKRQQADESASPRKPHETDASDAEIENEKIEDPTGSNVSSTKQEHILSENMSQLKTNDSASCKDTDQSYQVENITEEEKRQYLSVHKNRTEFKAQDLLVPWHLRKRKTQDDKEAGAKTEKKADDPVFHRYYHVFKQGELEELCSAIENVQVKTGYYDEGNWCVILEKSA